MKMKIELAFAFLFLSLVLYSQTVDIQDNNDLRIRLDPRGAYNSGDLRLYDNDGSLTAILSASQTDNNGAYLNLYNGNGSHRIQLDAYHNAGSEFYMRSSNGQYSIHAQTNIGSGISARYGVMDFFDNAGNRRIGLTAHSGLFGTTSMSIYEPDGDLAVSSGTGLYGGGTIAVYDAGGVARIRFQGAPEAGDYHFKVDGRMISEELRIQNSLDWPDYVFNEDYELQDLNSLAEDIKDLGHLPRIPSANEVEKEGIETGEMLKLQMEKIEELTLYILELHERIKKLEDEK